VTPVVTRAAPRPGDALRAVALTGGPRRAARGPLSLLIGGYLLPIGYDPEELLTPSDEPFLPRLGLAALLRGGPLVLSSALRERQQHPRAAPRPRHLATFKNPVVDEISDDTKLIAEAREGPGHR
jgi:hypothetical protein